MEKQMLNILFYSRALGSPDMHRPENMDRYPCTVNQIEMAERYGLPYTYLVDYLSVMDPRYKALLDTTRNCEIGAWFEIVKPLAEKAGIEWQGREGHIWDFHSHAVYGVGYTLEQRKLLIDIFMADYKEAFGRYPKSVGAWVIDAYSLNYMYEKYQITGFCFCRDQCGTDGYTLWGGYFGQGFYPSKNNMLCPANTKENQINVPMFRMLGSCPIYQYDFDMDIEKGPAEWMGVVTLEPVYKDTSVGGGGVPEWVDWFIKENYHEDTLSFNYVQMGQENTMGWNNQRVGLEDQFEKFSKLCKAGKIKAQTLSETAEDFKKSYEMTPASSISAFEDWWGNDTQSFWYNCKNFRLNFYKQDGKFWIRDMFIFDENYMERYRKELCTGKDLYFDNLPVMDGNRWSGGGVRAGIYPEILDNKGNYVPLSGTASVSYDYPNETITVSDNDTKFELKLGENGVDIKCNKEFRLKFNYSPTTEPTRLNKNLLERTYNGYIYSIAILKGKSVNDVGLFVLSENSEIQLRPNINM